MTARTKMESPAVRGPAANQAPPGVVERGPVSQWPSPRREAVQRSANEAPAREDPADPLDTVSAPGRAIELHAEEFKVEVLKTRVPPPMRASDVPDWTTPRTHDRFAPHVDPFIVAFNFWRFHQQLMWESLADLKHHEANSGLSADPAKAIGLLTDEEGGWLGAERQRTVPDLQNMRDSGETGTLRAASSEESVSGALRRFAAGHLSLTGGVAALQAVEADLGAHLGTLARRAAEAERAGIERSIEAVRAATGLLLGVSVDVAEVVADAGQARRRGPGRVGGLVAGTAAGIARLKHAEELAEIDLRLEQAEAAIGEGIDDALRARIAAARHGLQAGRVELEVAALELADAMEHKRNAYRAAGAAMDAPSSTPEHRMTRNEALLVMASLVREAQATCSEAAAAVENEAFVFWFDQRDLGRGLGGVPDPGQKALMDAMVQVRSFARWARTYRDGLNRMADGWKLAMATLGYPDEHY